MRQRCEDCLLKQVEIDRLTEEVLRLKDQLKKAKRKAAQEAAAPFGSSTPSAKIPLKPNTPTTGNRKKRGGQLGHAGAGRKQKSESEASQVVELPSTVGDLCPECHEVLAGKGYATRMVLESNPVQAEWTEYVLARKCCPRCRKTYQPTPPGVLPKSLYGNQLLATAAEMHYLHGIPMGRICEQIGIDPGSLVGGFHRLAELFKGVPSHLMALYRQSPVRHADETGWRTLGQNGYAWLFATETLSLFLFKKTRSGEVARQVLGGEALPGVLIVDRYAGYNKAPCAIQYCYAHLLREVQDLAKEFPDDLEVRTFDATLGPLLAVAMGLRNQTITDEAFSYQASIVKAAILAVVGKPAKHLGIRRIQDIFTQNAHRLYHWADNRNVPADNNHAERDLRPTVIARKVSFGSQSEAGAHTRSVMMSLLWSLRKQRPRPGEHLKMVLDQLALNMKQDPIPLLFPQAAPPEPPVHPMAPD